MRRWIARVLAALALAAGALFVLGPYEPVEVGASFEPRRFGEGVGVYLETVESYHGDIRPGAEKRVVWAGQRETRTPLSVVYLHGFSASAAEIRPVPDRVAEALGANLVYTRFRGHGRDGDAMAEGSVKAWMEDAAEALALGRATGERVIVVATSTGASIATVALADAQMSERVAGAVLISPNYGLRHPMAPLLTLPAARHWVPMLAGSRRSFEPRSPEQAAHWTTEYPSVAVFPMAAVVKHARGLDHGAIGVPALFIFSDEDGVVRADMTADVMARWGGETARVIPKSGPDDDPLRHVIAGDIMSPGATDEVTEAIIGWVRGLK
ncbi:carboxylesterase [Roseovarius sp. SCSIO 43702]|uniref:alpha/beta hydrolase n=1 Tax=Roseovarius sp. SCSIO 43702 TaxID=2823043 RepID=UPI0021760103|nr:alpha/beta fold hydrolase [Roseovarius sp. SCSIO 43702]